MEKSNEKNLVILRGNVYGPARFSHENHERKFMIFPLRVERLSGNEDIINVVADEKMLETVNPNEGDGVYVAGELRSYNNRSGQGSRLVITVFAQELYCDYGEHINEVRLVGTICKNPGYRTTPLGRDICDIMLAVGRRYKRSDYLPIIVWGRAARELSMAPTGTELRILGRIQSRKYIKLLDDEAQERTAYEVSAAEVEEIAPMGWV